MSELKHCPFCGGEAIMETHRFYQLPNTYSVKCLACNAQTNSIYTTEQRALDAWNRRATNIRKCGDCANLYQCEGYVDADETFPEVRGGCRAFKVKKEKTK